MLSVPQRAEIRERLLRCIAENGYSVSVYVDGAPMRNTLKPYMRLLQESLKISYKYVLVLEDDAVLQPLFFKFVEKYASYHEILSYYHNRKSIAEKSVYGEVVSVNVKQWLGMLAVSYSREVVERLCAFYEANLGAELGRDSRHSDCFLQFFVNASKIPFFCATKSLVSHGDVPSVMGHPGGRRTKFLFSSVQK